MSIPFSVILLAGALAAVPACANKARDNAEGKMRPTDPVAPESDHELIRGTWKYLSWKHGEHTVRVDMHHVVFDETKMKTIETRGEKVWEDAGDYYLDPGHDPKHIDTIWTKDGVTKHVRGTT